MQQLTKRSLFGLKKAFAPFNQVPAYQPKYFFSNKNGEDVEDMLANLNENNKKGKKKPFKKGKKNGDSENMNTQQAAKTSKFTSADDIPQAQESTKQFKGLDNTDFSQNIDLGDPSAPGAIDKSVEALQQRFNFSVVEDQKELQSSKYNPKTTFGSNFSPSSRFINLQNQRKAKKLGQDQHTKATEIRKNLSVADIPSYTPEGERSDPRNAVVLEQIKQLEEDNKQSHEAYGDYFVGEPGIDSFAVHPELDYALPNIAAKIQNDILHMRQQNSDEFYDVYSLMEWRKQSLLQYISDQLWTSKETEQKPLSFYPGSSKGPHPMDDTEHFCNWLLHNADSETRNQFAEISPEDLGLTKEEVELTEDRTQIVGFETLVQMQEPLFLSAANGPEGRFARDEALEFQYFNNTSHSEIPEIPDEEIPDPEMFQEQIEKFLLFQKFPELQNLYQSVTQTVLQYERSQVANMDSLKRGSIMGYYGTLPDFMRNSHVIRSVVRGMEFRGTITSLEEKEALLNFCLQFTLPIPDWVNEVMTDALDSHKYETSVAEEKHFLGDSDDEGEAEEDSGNKKKKKKKEAGEKKERVTAKQGSPFIDPNILHDKYSEMVFEDDLTEKSEWQYPTRHLDITKPRDPQPNLPIDYYDNDDGFWDNYLQWKGSQYDLHRIQLKHRRIRH